MKFLSVKDAQSHCLCTQCHNILTNVVYHFTPVCRVFACAGIACLAPGNDAFDVNCGKMKASIDLDILDRSITNRKITMLTRLHSKNLDNS